MENRRMLLVIALSVAVMFGWQQFSEYMGWAPKTVPVAKAPEQPPTQQIAAPQAQPAEIPAAPQGAVIADAGKEVIVQTPMYTATFSSTGGILKSFELNNYKASQEKGAAKSDIPVQLINQKAADFGPLSILINEQPTWFRGSWAYNGDTKINVIDAPRSVTFTGTYMDINIKRTFTFDVESYVLRERLELVASSPQVASLGYTISTGNITGPEEFQRLTKIAYLQAGSFKEEDSEKTLKNGITSSQNIAWAGNMGNYFIAALLPTDPSMRMDAKLQDGVYRIALKKTEIMLAQGQPVVYEMGYYLGPKRTQDLAMAPNELEKAIDYGWFSMLSKPLLVALKFFHSYVNNYGVAIILLTIVIKILLWPLSAKSYKSMEAMKRLQPLMTEIKEKYKDDKERMNREVMQLYKTYKINPMGGCLPIVVQLPIFVGLYRALLSAFELRHASFIEYLPFTDIVWLADLSIKDPLYVTPLLMGASMFLQQKLSPAVGDPTQAKIMMFMPIIFTVMFMSFPSGLVIYWLANNIISIGQQQWQLRRKA